MGRSHAGAAHDHVSAGCLVNDVGGVDADTRGQDAQRGSIVAVESQCVIWP